jgi:hypothetical protein
MGPMKLHFDIRDIFRAPRLALSGKKIWIFIVGNIVGYVSYWILTYVAFALAGMNFPRLGLIMDCIRAYLEMRHHVLPG